ncbi:MAG TPA: OmcA/MtrC family decaheme c-type cytochrome [Bryobacteraceae bacterium]
MTLILAGATHPPFSKNQKALYADPHLVAFVRPGLAIKISSAQIAQDGTISAVFTLTDSNGAPLDRTGVATPGAVSLNFIADYIPKGQRQYVDYITRSATGTVSGTVTQAAAESNGSFAVVGDGYRYTFSTHAPAGFDQTTTHTIGIYASRDLTEFDLGTNYASATFNFVPNGSAVTLVRDVIRTSSCNRCHDQLSAHGGSRRGIEMCVLCHTPQTTDPDTGNTLDLPVMAHKIHMGSELPSVQAGKPYQIIGFQGSVSDWSSVVLPSDPRRCEACHEQNSGATEANAYYSRPARAACGACHDDVNFATGANHAGGPQISDNQCAICHIPQGELEFDASVKGAHVVPVDSTSLKGLVFQIQKIESGLAGQKPKVTFTVKDKSGAAVPLSSLNNLSFVMAGPTTDYGQTSFGSDVTTPGYVSESATTAAQCGADGVCTYTFVHAVPSGAHGTFAIGMEGRRTETLLPGTVTAMDVQYGGDNKVTYFSVDASGVQPRRKVADIANCNQCHVDLALHGSNRNDVEMCVLCHNPNNTDSAQRFNATDPAERTKPPQGINFSLLIHRIHMGENLKDAGKSYTVIGRNGSINDFTHVRFPLMSPQGGPGDTRNCDKCHTGDSQLASGGVNDVLDPQGFINPVKPNSSACIGCHVTAAESSHVLANTTSIGESCAVCHGAGSAFAVDKSHAQY